MRCSLTEILLTLVSSGKAFDSHNIYLPPQHSIDKCIGLICSCLVCGIKNKYSWLKVGYYVAVCYYIIGWVISANLSNI